jgi:hypothetical protein
MPKWSLSPVKKKIPIAVRRPKRFGHRHLAAIGGDPFRAGDVTLGLWVEGRRETLPCPEGRVAMFERCVRIYPPVLLLRLEKLFGGRRIWPQSNQLHVMQNRRVSQ